MNNVKFVISKIRENGNGNVKKVSQLLKGGKYIPREKSLLETIVRVENNHYLVLFRYISEYNYYKTLKFKIFSGKITAKDGYYVNTPKGVYEYQELNQPIDVCPLEWLNYELS